MSHAIAAFYAPRIGGFRKTSSPRLCPSRPTSRQSMAIAFVSDEMIQRLSKLLKSGNGSQIAIGTFVGFASGYAIRRVGQLIILLVGLQVMSLQLMANYGWVDVKWPVISRDLSPHMEKNTVDRVIDAVKLKLPFAGSFSAGCYAGLKWR